MSLRLLCCSGSLEGGGSERQLWQLATHVDPSLFAPQIYLLYRRGTYVDQVPDRIPIQDFWSTYETPFLKLPGQIRRAQVAHLKQVLRDQEIDVVYDRTFHMTLVTGAACRAAGVPRVSVIVSPPSRDFAGSGERFAWVKRRLLARYYRDPLSTTLAVSPAVAEDAANYYRIQLSRIRVLPSPVDIEGIERAARESSDDSEHVGCPRICVVGRLSREKGQRVAIQAFARAVERLGHARLTLDVVGDGPDRADLERLAGALGMQDRVRFHGFLPNPYPTIASSDLMVIPSEYEGLPNVALEAMALGTGVIATDCSGSLTCLIRGDERGEIVPVGDVERLSAAIVDRFLQPEPWMGRVAAARRVVEQEHDLQSWVATMQKLLARTCQRDPMGDAK